VTAGARAKELFAQVYFFAIATTARTVPPNVVEMISVQEKSNHPRTASEQNIHDVWGKSAETRQRAFWQGQYLSYRGKVKNSGNHRNASDNVEHIFGNGFEHKPPPWRTPIRANEH
jgi:hypothetical protein